MKFTIKYILLFIICALNYSVFAQEAIEKEASNLSNPILLGKHIEGKNILRWAPRNYALWQTINETGYIIDRFEIEKGNLKAESKKRLTPLPLKPLTIEQWKAQFEAENRLAAIAVQTLYGTTEKGESQGVFGDVVAQHMQQENLFGFGMLVADASKEIAEAMALRFEDTSIESDKQYVYLLYADSKTDDVPSDTSWLALRNDKKFPLPHVRTLAALEEEHAIMLKWSAIENIYPPSGYFVEHSIDGGKTFSRLNEMPHIAMSNASDSLGTIHDKEVSYKIKLEENYKPIQYRVLAFNAFGEMSTSANIITAMGRDRTAPPQPRLKNPKEMGDVMMLNWDMPEDSEPLQGFVVGHSNDAQGPFFAIHNEILPPDNRVWTDEKAKTRAQNYYIISAIDTAGNISNSLPVYSKFIDSIPPAKPVELIGSVDTAGLMTLTWAANTEADLMGYNVWFANNPDHEFIQINNAPFTADTFTQLLQLHTLTEEIYYQVVALDINFNPSERSDILMVKKPDIIAPVAPQIHTITATENGMAIFWNNSSSKDIESHFIKRKQIDEISWETLTEVTDLTQTSWIDHTAEVTLLYDYQVVGKDDAGLLSSASNIVTGRVFHPSKKEGIAHLNGKQIKEEKLIRLSWEHSITTQGFTFYLYRAQEDGKLRLYKSLDADVLEFSDTQVDKNTRYRYAVKVVYATGSVSDMSEEVELALN